MHVDVCSWYTLSIFGNVRNLILLIKRVHACTWDSVFYDLILSIPPLHHWSGESGLENQRAREFATRERVADVLMAFLSCLWHETRSLECSRLVLLLILRSLIAMFVSLDVQCCYFNNLLRLSFPMTNLRRSACYNRLWFKGSCLQSLLLGTETMHARWTTNQWSCWIVYFLT